jgi:hypothetical protein
MLTHADIMAGRERYNEMLREAEMRQKMKGYEIEQPNIFGRTLAALKSALKAKLTRPAPAQSAAVRQNLATE